MATRPIRGSSPAARAGAGAAGGRRAHSALAVHAAAAAVLALSCVPLLLGPQLPLVDMPSHLARIEIIDQLLRGGPLSEFWAFEPGLVSNLLFDGVGWAMYQAFPVEAVGSIYLALTLAAQLFGTVLLHRSLHGRYSYWPLASALLLYNLTFLYGFLSYLAGVGLALLSLALWVRLGERPALMRLAAGSVAATLLFFAHIVPLMVYAAAVAGYELQAAGKVRHQPMAALARLAVGAAQFLLPAALFLRNTSTADLAHEALAFDLVGKIASLPATATAGAVGLDVFAMVAVGACLLLAPLALRVRFAASFVAAFLFVLAAFAVMPWGMGPVVNLDTRMPLAILFIAIAATDVTFARPRLALVLSCVLAVTVLVRVAGVGIQTARFSGLLGAYRTAFAQIPEGAVLFTGVNDRCAVPPLPGEPCRERPDPPPGSLLQAPLRLLYPGIYRRRIDVPPNVGALASIDRDAFVPQIFATRGLQPTAIRAPLLRLKALQQNNPIEVRTPAQMHLGTAALLEAAGAALPGRPVFLLQQRLEGAADIAPEGGELIARGPQFALYRLVPGSP